MIKEIEGLRKYNVCSVPVNEEERTNNAKIEAYNQALIDVIELVKNCSIPDVSQQRELLLAWEKHSYGSEWSMHEEQIAPSIDEYLSQ